MSDTNDPPASGAVERLRGLLGEFAEGFRAVGKEVPQPFTILAEYHDLRSVLAEVERLRGAIELALGFDHLGTLEEDILAKSLAAPTQPPE